MMDDKDKGGAVAKSPLRDYDGKRCRVYLVNGYCVVGDVQFNSDDWLTVRLDAKKSCTVNTSQIITIGEL